ncbi:MAG: hypothetical protein J6Y99_10195 [Bacteroidales bacterium]|nr:hypothetical protein [Bacteroidales bacterium]
MSIFTVQKPKRFERTPRYSNERKEYIEQRKRQIMRENGMLPVEDMNAEELIRGKFIEGTTHVRRRREKEEEEGPSYRSKRLVKMLVWLIVLVMLLQWLIKEVFFK